MLYNVVLTFQSVDKALMCDLLWVKATEHYFFVVHCSYMLYMVVLTFQSVDKILMCDLLWVKATEHYFFCGTVHYICCIWWF